MKTHIRRKNIQSFCRTCLAEIAKYSVGKGQKFNIHKTEDLAKWIKESTQLHVEQNDEYPKYLCQKCYSKLLSFSEFRETCKQSMHILDGILGKNESDTRVFTAEEVIVTKIEFCDDETQKVEETDWLSFDAKNDIVTEAEQENTGVNKNMATAKFENRETYDDMFNIKEAEQVKDETKTTLKTDETFDCRNCTADATGQDVDKFVNIVNSSSEHAMDECSGNESESSTSFLNDINPKRIKRLRSSIVKKQGSEQECVKSLSKRFVCEFCQRRCISEQNLAAHLRIHQGLRPHQCNQCERAFNRSSRLKAHIQETHRANVELIKCSFEGCDKEYRRADTVRTHYRLKHTGIQKPIKRSYMCEDCGRTFNNVTILKEHRYTHRPTEEYPYKCDLCEKRYISQRTFKEHQMRHAGIKNYECPYCGMRKTTRSELLTHVNYHTKEKKWPCPSCPSVFNSSANLGLHNRIVHKGIRAYSCRYCEQSFGKAETLKHHEMRHTGEKPHECQTCGKRFIQVVALRAHLKIHNKTDGNGAKKTVKRPQQSLTEEDVLVTCLP